MSRADVLAGVKAALEAAATQCYITADHENRLPTEDECWPQRDRTPREIAKAIRALDPATIAEAVPETDTPSVDSEAGEVVSTESGCAFDAVNADFARGLERELAALRRDAERLDLIQRTGSYPWLDYGGVWKFRVGNTLHAAGTLRGVLDIAMASDSA